MCAGGANEESAPAVVSENFPLETLSESVSEFLTKIEIIIACGYLLRYIVMKFDKVGPGDHHGVSTVVVVGGIFELLCKNVAGIDLSALLPL